MILFLFFFFAIVTAVHDAHNNGGGCHGGHKIAPGMVPWAPVKGTIRMIKIGSVAVIVKASIPVWGPYICTSASSYIGVSVVDGDISTSVDIDVIVSNPVITPSVTAVNVSGVVAAVDISGVVAAVCGSVVAAISCSVSCRGTSIGRTVFNVGCLSVRGGWPTGVP